MGSATQRARLHTTLEEILEQESIALAHFVEEIIYKYFKS